MASAKEYRKELSSRGLDRMEFSASSVSEAKAALASVGQKQKELRAIKRRVNQDMAEISQEYRERTDAAVKTVGVLGVFAKKRTKGRLRGRQRERLRKERERRLGPYKSVKLYIDDLLVKLDGAKVQLQAYVDRNR